MARLKAGDSVEGRLKGGSVGLGYFEIVRYRAFMEEIFQAWIPKIRISTATRVTIADQGAAVLDGVLSRVFLKLDRVALGLSVGIITGIGLFLTTLTLVLRGGESVGSNLRLLGQYLPVYTVTVSESFIGLLDGFVSGFIGGWGYALLRNSTMFLYLAAIHRRAELNNLRKLFRYF